MSRKTEKRSRRRAREFREKRERIQADIERIVKSGPIEMSMSHDQTIELIGIAMTQIAQEMTRSGGARKQPWGIAYDPAMLEASIRTGVVMLGEAFKQLDKIDTEATTAEEQFRTLGSVVTAAITIAGCSGLLMQSSPIPYSLARVFVVKDAPSKTLN